MSTESILRHVGPAEKPFDLMKASYVIKNLVSLTKDPEVPYAIREDLVVDSLRMLNTAAEQTRRSPESVLGFIYDYHPLTIHRWSKAVRETGYHVPREAVRPSGQAPTRNIAKRAQKIVRFAAEIPEFEPSTGM